MSVNLHLDGDPILNLALVSERDHEVPEPMFGVVLHDMPHDRAQADGGVTLLRQER